MDRAMTPTGCVIALVLAFVIDYLSVGPDSIRDRIAFLIAVAGFRDGFNGSPLDQWTVQRAHDAIGYLLSLTGDAYIAGASINGIIGALIGCLALYTVGCLLPEKASKFTGRLAKLSFPGVSGRINWKLWLCAFLIGVLAELPRGLIGGWTEGVVVLLTQLTAPLIVLLFGAA